jgi:hypothetical protein
MAKLRGLPLTQTSSGKIGFQVDFNFTPSVEALLTNSKVEMGRIGDRMLRGVATVAERNYKLQSPVDDGELRRQVRVTRPKKGERLIRTNAVNDRGEAYPVALHRGTGRLKGAADFGYTRGRVRSGDIGRLGGIRPNKFATRATEDTQKVAAKTASNILQPILDGRIKV